MYKGNLYFNYQELKDVLIIIIDNDAIADRIVNNDNFYALYSKDSLIGVNIFNSNEYLKLKISGLFHNPNEPFVNLIHDLIKTNLNEDVIIESSLTYLAQIKRLISNNKYEIDLGKSKAIANSLEPVEIEEYVLVSKRGSRLDDGNLCDKYLGDDSEYLIVAKEIDGLENELGVQTYYIMDGK